MYLYNINDPNITDYVDNSLNLKKITYVLRLC